MNKPKIYLFCLPHGRDVVAYAVTTEAECLAQHLSSNEGFAKHDIGLTSDWHHDAYRERYPDGYEVEWVDDPVTHSYISTLLVDNSEETA